MRRWWVERDGRQITVTARELEHGWEVTVDGRTHVVDMVAIHPGLHALFCPEGRTFAVASQRLGRDHHRVLLAQRQFEVVLRDPLERATLGGRKGRSGPREVKAPIPGKVMTIAVAVGDEITKDQALLVLEAMKMENQICAEGAGTVERVLVSPGTTVDGGQVLIVLA